LRGGPWRYALGAAVIAVAALLVVLATRGGGHSHKPVIRAAVSAVKTSRTVTSSSTTAAATQTAHRIAVAEVADPEEAKSFPVAGSVHHKAAIKPSSAAATVAPGAPSDAEVRRELHQMQALEHAARSQELKTVPGGGSIGGSGTITPPEGIPAVIARVIAGGNAIADFPYVFGGGHASFVDNAYDCSGSVSYALAAGGLLNAPETSGALESWGAPGPGKWITVYANAGHT
jgi:cell wall-associated NlpC family hydrolase